jgi:hypothetical protein
MPEPPRAAPEPARAPVAPPAAAAERHATPASDQNLSEMAQRLEAAMRRAAPAPAAEPPPVQQAPTAPITEAPRAEDSGDKAEQPEKRKSLYESLEQEMASLLGRPTNKK